MRLLITLAVLAILTLFGPLSVLAAPAAPAPREPRDIEFNDNPNLHAELVAWLKAYRASKPKIAKKIDVVIPQNTNPAQRFGSGPG